jgi:hypothetical protein
MTNVSIEHRVTAIPCWKRSDFPAADGETGVRLRTGFAGIAQDRVVRGVSGSDESTVCGIEALVIELLCRKTSLFVEVFLWGSKFKV